MVWGVVANIPTEKERTKIAEFFTKLRESVDPPASNMQLRVGYEVNGSMAILPPAR
uniref:Cytochrome P450 n=1 Tax=Mesocestoides corti TaxID=53468 RepID=A0A5K3FUG2_MESCO